jgi:hypothetical protein
VQARTRPFSLSTKHAPLRGRNNRPQSAWKQKTAPMVPTSHAGASGAISHLCLPLPRVRGGQGCNAQPTLSIGPQGFE